MEDLITVQSRASALEKQGTDNFLSGLSFKGGPKVAKISLVLPPGVCYKNIVRFP
jgi:hypothetical protein